MKPHFEHVTVAPGESWTLLWRELPELPFLWHHHPEYELTLTLNARGQRYVGDHLADFEPGDLVLLGPHQPHTWSAHERPDPSQPMLAVVVWFGVNWLEQLLACWPEMGPLQRLTRQAGRGLHFSREAAQRAQPHLLALNALTPAQRLPVLLQILLLLAEDTDASPLATHAGEPLSHPERDRLGRVFDHLHAHLQNGSEAPRLSQLADIAALSVGAFHRFFKRHTGLTVLEYLTQLRIGKACQLLIDSDRPVRLIAWEAGYRNIAHFNRQFRSLKGLTPSAFRSRHRLTAPPVVSEASP